MANVKVKLLRPLNGQEIGKIVEYDQANAARLAESGAVELVKEAKAPENKAVKSAPENKTAGKAK